MTKMSKAPEPGSPEKLIEDGYAMISQGLYRLYEANRHVDAQYELATLVSLFLEDKLRVMKITGKII